MTRNAQPQDQNPFLFAPSGWNDHWLAAKAAAPTTPAAIFFLGDSFSNGQGASDAMTRNWTRLVRDFLARSIPVAGEIYSALAATGSGLWGSSPSLPYAKTATNNITWAAFSATQYPLGIAANNAAVAFGATGDYTWTSPNPCSAIDLILWDAAAATFQFNIDGGIPAGAQISISPGYATPTPGASTWTVTPQGWNTLYRVSITGLANAIHTVTLGGCSAGNAFWLGGIAGYTGSPGGLLFAFCGIGGQTGANYGGTSTTGAPQTFAGRFKTSSGDTSHPTGFGFPTQPNLAIIQFGINDCSGQNGPMALYDGLRRLIGGLRRGRDNCSIMLLGVANPDPDFSDSSPSNVFPQSQDWPRYLAALYDLAVAYNCAFLNIHARWGQTSVAKGFLPASASPHPTDAGYADMAALIQGYL